MRLVLDTNVFVSSFFWGGNPREIMTRIIDGKDILYVSREILQEVLSVMLRPKFKMDYQEVIRFVDSIEDVANRVPYRGIVRGVCRDSNDDKILECAILGNVDRIISGDNDLLVLKAYRGIPIITASEYIKQISSTGAISHAGAVL
jgi:putative PIN family toxin of toxin-antitoxin system